jgi:tripartite-type tricarboxylate transporter receptor subunit TctC
MKRLRFVASLLAFVVTASMLPAQAQERFPSRPVKLVVGYPPGGSVDALARNLADVLAAKLETTVVVENVGGAAGAIGAARVAASPADGYTLLVGSSNELVGTGILNRDQKYDGRKDFTPLTLAATAPLVLVAGTKSGVRTLDEFIETVRRNPGKFSYGSPGIGSTMHLAGELAKQRAGLFVTHIPYRGVAPLTTDLVGNAIEFGFMSPPAAAPLIQSGRLVGVGVSGRDRLALLPQVPAISEHPALAGYELTGWVGVLAPKGLPADLEERLMQGLRAALQDPVYRRRIEEVGGVPASGREDFMRLLNDETDKYLKLAAFAKLR